MTGKGVTQRYCAPLPVPAHDPTLGSRAALLNAVFWGRDTELTIGFMSGSRELRERVRDLAMEWLERTKARLHFQFWTAENVDPSPAAIRVGFDPARGSWSWLGKQAKRIASGEPTMNLGWMTMELDERSARAVVLHEFGHALGLIHEHLHPFANIDWDRERVISDLRSSQGWDEETVTSNMFDVPPADQVFATTPDNSSIMMYPIPPEWIRSGQPVGWNGGLSADDIRLVQAAYGVRDEWSG